MTHFRPTRTLVIIGLLIFLTALFFPFPNLTKAIEKNDSTRKLSITVDKASALADGEDKIQINLGAFWVEDQSSDPDPPESDFYDPSIGASLSTPKPFCVHNSIDNTIKGYGSFTLWITGTANTITNGSGSVINPYNNSQEIYQPEINCTTGYTNLYLSSTTAENKSIKADICSKGGCYGLETLTAVAFTNPTSAPTPTLTDSPKPTLSLASKAKLTSGGTSQTIESSTTPTITTKEKLTFTGTATANAKVTITITSDPITAEVTADKDGNWIYTLDPQALSLALGHHTVTAIATDSKGTSSDPVELTKFTLESTPVVNQDTTKNTSFDYFSTLNIILGILVILLLGVLITLIVIRTKSKKRIAAKS